MKKALVAILIVAAIAVSYTLGRRRTGLELKAGGARRVLYYVDPMHPAYKSDKPGIAPDCGMKLEPVYADERGQPAAASSPAEAPPGTIDLDSDKQQLIGIRTVPVESSTGPRSIRLLGRVAADDTRVYRVGSGVEGWVQQTFEDSVGTRVRKNQRLAAYYSRELWSAEQSYLAGTYTASPSVKDTPLGVQNVTDRLRNLGVTEAQLHEIATSRQASETSYFASPIDGFILSRTIAAGEKFEKGMEFYRIADLSRVWIIAEVVENEASYFRPGTVARITLPAARRSLSARVSSVLPQIDPATRTLKLRLEADNPGFALRPDMFVDVDLTVPAPSGLSVPADAVLDFGLKQRVFVDCGAGIFEPREVETGDHFGGRIQILRGLTEGEHVVFAGTFLIDSESKLRAAAK
jgi:multidrug efflux pump subunit AcrA (membrane-fusion protein)